MKAETALYEYLYQMLLYQFYSGSLRRGQKFPSQSELCRQYNVGITTARRVVRMLEKDGFIQTNARRRSTVIYEVDNRTYIHAILQRRQTIFDILNGFELILPVLQLEGARRCTDPAVLAAIVSGISSTTEHQELYNQASHFLLELLRPFNNQTMYDLQTDSENITHIPYLPVSGLEDHFTLAPMAVKNNLAALLEAVRTRTEADLRDSIYRLYRGGREHAAHYLNALELHCDEKAPDHGIQNFVAKTRAHLYTVISRKLYRRIQDGEFDNCKYIPSVPDLMKEYAVSQATALNAVAILNDIGAVRTIDKKGTVAADPGAPLSPLRMDPAAIGKNLIYFLDAMQILTICSGNLAQSILAGMDSRTAAAAARRWDHSGFCSSGIVIRTLLAFFKENAPYRSLYNLFEQMDYYLIWGHYLERRCCPMPEVDSRAAGLFVSLRSALAQMDAERFSGCTRLIFLNAFETSRQLIISCGMPLDKLPAALDMKEQALL